MNIAFVINRATHTSIPLEMADKLSKTDRVTVLSLYDDQARVDEICSSVAPACFRIGFNFKKKWFPAINGLIQELCSGKYEIVHTHQTFSGSLARWILRNHDEIKVVHTVHADHHSFSFLQNIVIGSSLPFCDGIIFNSQATKEGLMNWQKRLIKDVPGKVVYNGIDVARIRNASREKETVFCKEFSLNDGTFLFAQVGRLEPVKNPQFTLEAFCKLVEADRSSDMKLVFVGDGSLRKQLAEYIDEHDGLKNKVIMTGMIRRDEVYSLMHRIDGLIVPSLHEGFCNALFEGLAAGIPVIASDIQVFRELIEEDVGVMKVSNRNDEELVMAMKDLVESRPEASAKEKAVRFAFDNFDISRCVDSYRAFYHDVLGGSYAASH